jgi:hypothetical protein
MSEPANTNASQIARPTVPAVAAGFEEPLRGRRRESDHGDLESLLPNFVIEACSLVHALGFINLTYGKEKCLWLHVLDHAFPKSKAALEICKFHSKIMWLWVGAEGRCCLLAGPFRCFLRLCGPSLRRVSWVGSAGLHLKRQPWNSFPMTMAEVTSLCGSRATRNQSTTVPSLGRTDNRTCSTVTSGLANSRCTAHVP